MFGNKGKKPAKVLPVTHIRAVSDVDANASAEMVEVLIQRDDEENSQSNQVTAAVDEELEPLDNTQITLRINCGDPGGAAEAKKLRVQLLDGREWSSCDDACREAFRDLIKFLVIHESDDRLDRALQQKTQELLNYKPLSDGTNSDLKIAIKKSKVMRRFILDMISLLIHARSKQPREFGQYITSVPCVIIDESRFGLSQQERPEGQEIPMYQWAALFDLVRAEERSNVNIRWKQNAYGLAAGIAGVMLMCGVVMQVGVLSASAEYASQHLLTSNVAIAIGSIGLIGMIVCITLGCRHKTSGGKLASGQHLSRDGESLVHPAQFRFMEAKELDRLLQDKEEKDRLAEEKSAEDPANNGTDEGPNPSDGVTL